MDMETPLDAGRLFAIDGTASEDFISMASVPQFASAVSFADGISLQNLDGSSKEIPATHEPLVVQEGPSEGDAIVQSYNSPRNWNGEEAVGDVLNTLVDSHSVFKMENLDVEPVSPKHEDLLPVHAHDSPKHEELLSVDSWPASPLCEEHVSSFSDTAPSAEPMTQTVHVPSGDSRGELSSVFAEEGTGEINSLDLAVAEEPASTFVASVGKGGILKNANVMQAENVATENIDAIPNEAVKEGLALVSPNMDFQKQVGGVTPLPDLVAVVGPSPIIKEEEPSAVSIPASDPVAVVGPSPVVIEEEPFSVSIPATEPVDVVVVGPSPVIKEEEPSSASIPATDPVAVIGASHVIKEAESSAESISSIDLFESASIRELQNMLMDSSLKHPEIASALHNVGVERVEHHCEIPVAQEFCGIDLGDIKMLETAMVEGEMKEEKFPSAFNADSLIPAGEQGLVSGVATQQIKDCFAFDASQKGEENTETDVSVCMDLGASKVCEVVGLKNMAPESTIPANNVIEELHEAENKLDTEGEVASKDCSSVYVMAEVETDGIMEIDKHIQDLEVSFEGGLNNEAQMDLEIMHVFQEPQQFRKRGRKPGKKLVKNVEKDASTGLLQESEPEKETGDSPTTYPMEGELKRELRKRGRKPVAAKVVQKEEEDVCFVCFDGGKLILCDKRSCPKAYHVDCTGRESEFFEKKGQWFCGWHVCSQCSKSANLNCYMCPSALCSTCIKGANFLFIRKGRGLCEGCYPIVHMIEYDETVKGDSVQVDFNDKETYEGLFKEYWEELKLKHSLTSTEFKKACKAREAGGISGEGETNNDEVGMNVDAEGIMGDENGGSTDSEDQPPAVQFLKRKRLTRQSVAEDSSASEMEEDESDDEVKLESTPKKGRMKAPEFDGWASKELGDLIRSLKEDPKKQLPLYGVKKLLWRYIDDNKLTNPRRRGQIFCDKRLHKLFGKKLVGRFEMMKLISLHVASPNKLMLSKGGESQFNESDAVELDDIEKNQLGKKKVRRKGDDKRLKPDPSEYAAVNVKNINLIYLKRSVLDELRNDPELESKAMGALVRIRVPGSTNKNDACYRLVQVIGVKQIYDALDPEKVTDVILEIMNLHKREEITADLVSNQELVEEECRRLRQSVRCGLIKPMRVGELEERARALREAKVKDWREFELLRLSHLRDRASEKGRKKELRECVEKLQLLSTPEEKERLLNAPFDIDADPLMDPDYESDEEDSPTDDAPVEMSAPPSAQEKTLPSRFSEKGNSTGSAEKLYNHRDSGTALEFHKSLYDTQQKSFAWGQKDPGSSVNGRPTADMQAQGWNSLPDTPSDKNTTSGQSKAGWGDGARVRDQPTGWNHGIFGRKELRWTGNSGGNVQSTGGGGWRNENVEVTPRFPLNQADVAAERASGQVFSPIQTPTPAMSGGPLVSGANTGTMVIDSEKEKIWCYLDPTRTVQGPFTMEQLRKWEKTNLFPLDLRIWRVTESQDTTVLLSDVLAGRFASRGQRGPSHLLPGSAQSHVNGIPVQGLNANNVSIGQTGGGIPSGPAQGTLSSSVPPQQCPAIQSFQSSVQGLHAHSFTPGPMQGPNAQGFSSAAPVHAPNIHGFPTVPTQGPNVRNFAPAPTQGPYVNNFSAAPLQGTPIQGTNGYPPNAAQGINVLPGQVQTPMVMQGRPQGPNITAGQMQGPNVHPGQAQTPNVMHGSHFGGNAHLGHPRGPHANHFPMRVAPAAVHNNAPHMGPVVSSSSMDFRTANLPNRHTNEWQEIGRRSGPDQQFGGPSSYLMEAANESGARVISTRSPWRQGHPGASRQDNRDARNRGQFGRSQNFRGSEHFQGSDGRFLPKKDLFCKYFSRGLCKKGQACDFRHE